MGVKERQEFRTEWREKERNRRIKDRKERKQASKNHTGITSKVFPPSRLTDKGGGERKNNSPKAREELEQRQR